MKQITKYVAKDGKEFDFECDAFNHEALLFDIEKAMEPLGLRCETDKGWIQHDRDTVDCVKDAILEICRQQGLNKSFKVFDNKGRDCNPFGIICRILSDLDTPIYSAWSRIMCIDDLGREHNHPDYAKNGPDADQKLIEDRR
jgi:hypothetical protein